MKKFNPAILAVSFVSIALFFGISIWAWGDVHGFFDHPARLILVIGSVLVVIVAAFSGSSVLSSGKREDRSNRWIFIPFTVLSLAFAWIGPYDDRHNIWTIDGDTARYTGVVLYYIGCALRLIPVFQLGRRFSGLVAIQENHQLKTDGLYRTIRHPSYVGLMLICIGWALTFRSVIGLVIGLLILIPLVARMNSEEKLLLSEFGDAYASYKRRTWRMIPFVY